MDQVSVWLGEVSPRRTPSIHGEGTEGSGPVTVGADACMAAVVPDVVLGGEARYGRAGWAFRRAEIQIIDNGNFPVTQQSPHQRGSNETRPAGHYKTFS